MRIHHCNERHISLILCILPRGSCLLLDIVDDWHHGISIRCLLMSLVMQIYLVNIKPLCRLVIQVVAEDDHHHALASGGYSNWTFLLFLWKHHSWRTWSTMHLCVNHSALHWGMVYDTHWTTSFSKLWLDRWTVQVIRSDDNGTHLSLLDVTVKL